MQYSSAKPATTMTPFGTPRRTLFLFAPSKKSRRSHSAVTTLARSMSQPQRAARYWLSEQVDHVFFEGQRRFPGLYAIRDCGGSRTTACPAESWRLRSETATRRARQWLRVRRSDDLRRTLVGLRSRRVMPGQIGDRDEIFLPGDKSRPDAIQLRAPAVRWILASAPGVVARDAQALRELTMSRSSASPKVLRRSQRSPRAS